MDVNTKRFIAVLLIILRLEILQIALGNCKSIVNSMRPSSLLDLSCRQNIECSYRKELFDYKNSFSATSGSKSNLGVL